MNDAEVTERAKDDEGKELVFEYELDAPPEKVWRALSIPEFRERWLPSKELAGEESVTSVPGEEVSYRIKDDEPPFLESEVRFRIRPSDDGGTALTIVHSITDARLIRALLTAANDDRFTVMRAA